MQRVDRKDFSPPEHSTKVADMARQLGEAKGFKGARLHAIYIAGLVHDIGKACIPDEVIKKPKPSSEEMALIRKYPEFGVDLLEPIAAMRPLQSATAIDVLSNSPGDRVSSSRQASIKSASYPQVALDLMQRSETAGRSAGFAGRIRNILALLARE